MAVRGQNHAWLCRTDGSLITDSIYQTIEGHVYYGKIRAQKMLGKKSVSGFLDIHGKEVVPFEYDNAEPFTYGIAVVTQKGRHFLLDTLGNLRPIYTRYKKVTVFKPGILLVELDNLVGFHGLIRYDGSKITPFDYASIYASRVEHLYVAQKGPFRAPDSYMDQQYRTLIDSSGKVIIPMDYQEIRVSDNYISLERYGKNEGIRHFDLSGKPITEEMANQSIVEKLPAYLASKKYPNGTVYGLKDSLTGKLLTPVVFDRIRNAGYGWLAVENSTYSGGKEAGYMTWKGDIVFRRRYVQNKPVSPKDILFYNDAFKGPWRWYDGQGREILPGLIKKMDGEFMYYNLLPPGDTTGYPALAVSLEGKKIGLYDRSGKMILPEKFDSLIYLSANHLWFKEGTQSGIINAKGEILTSNIPRLLYRTGYFSPDGYALIRTYDKGKSGLISATGKGLLPGTYPNMSLAYVDYKGRNYLWCSGNSNIEVYEVLPESKPRE